jgi:hypothetical protein
MSLKWNILIAGLASALLGLIFFQVKDNNINIDRVEPTLYFSKGTIEQFDGTPRGSYDLYRIRGFGREPELLSSHVGNTYLPAPLTDTKYVLTRPHNYGPVTGVFSSELVPELLTIGVELDGTEVVTNPPKIENTVYPGSAVLSSDERYLAQSSVICTRQTVDEPCPTAFVIRIFDYKSGQVQELRALDFPNLQNGGRAVLHFLNTTTLLIDIQDLQESATQQLYTLNLETKKFEKLYSNIKLDGSLNTNYQIVRVIDEKSVLAVEFHYDQNSTSNVVTLNLTTMDSQIVDEMISGGLIFNEIQTSGYFFTPDYNYGLAWRDFEAHTTRILVDRGDPRAVTKDGRYVVTFEPYTESGGYGSGRLLLWDTHRQDFQIIFDQNFGNATGGTINASSVPPLKVGDAVYGFVSLEMDGVPALDNPLN